MNDRTKALLTTALEQMVASLDAQDRKDWKKAEEQRDCAELELRRAAVEARNEDRMEAKHGPKGARNGEPQPIGRDL
jgi:hypothetical protein